MIRRTNIALGVGVALYFLPHVNNKLLFFPIVLISSLVPEIPTVFSNTPSGIKNPNKTSILRRLFRSYITAVVLALTIAFIYPVVALPFFLGYSFTLSLDAFSKEGIQPFWPISKRKTDGHITVGSRIDTALFYIFVLFDIALLIKLFL